MTAPRAIPARFLRAASVSIVAMLLASCAGQPSKPEPASKPADRAQAPAKPPRKPWKPAGPYTPGGLYAPGVADGAPDVPPDIASLPEPVPHSEPPSRYGNRSPYVVLGKTYTVLPSAAGYLERGMASWYGTKFDGRVTSSFEPYDLSQFTAAHRTLPLPSYARVTNLENGRSVIVRVNDRGPFHEGRLIDLSYAAAIKLGVNVHGTAMVEVRGIDAGQPPEASSDDAAAAKPAATHTVGPAPRPVPPKPAPVGRTSFASPGTVVNDDGAGRAAASKPDADAQPTPVASKDQASPPSDAPGPVEQAAITKPATPEPPPALVTPLPQPVPQPQATVSAAASPAVPAPSIAQAVVNASVLVPTPPVIPAAAAVAPITSLIPQVTSSVRAPGPAAAAAPAPTPVVGHPAIDPTTRGFLQIASYGDRGNAERMMKRLQQAGVEHAELVSVQVADQTLWRVHIGPMRADEADQVAAHLDALGFGTPPFFKE